MGGLCMSSGESAVRRVEAAVSWIFTGVVAEEEGCEEESHFSGLWASPKYTRPDVWRGREVPRVLRTGHHANIRRWRHEQSLLRTAQKRPELLQSAELTQKDLDFLREQGFSLPSESDVPC